MKDPYINGLVINLSKEDKMLVPKLGSVRADKFTTHRVSDEDTLFTIAHMYYGDTTYWWDIAEYNLFEDPVVLTPGAIINIPIFND